MKTLYFLLKFALFLATCPVNFLLLFGFRYHAQYMCVCVCVCLCVLSFKGPRYVPGALHLASHIYARARAHTHTHTRTHTHTHTHTHARARDTHNI